MQKIFYPKHIGICHRCGKETLTFCVISFDDEIGVEIAETPKDVYIQTYKRPMVLCEKCYNKVTKGNFERDRKESETIIWQ